MITVTVGTVERRSIDNNEFSIQAAGVTGTDRCCTSVLFFSLIIRAVQISFHVQKKTYLLEVRQSTTKKVKI